MNSGLNKVYKLKKKIKTLYKCNINDQVVNIRFLGFRFYEVTYK